MAPYAGVGGPFAAAEAAVGASLLFAPQFPAPNGSLLGTRPGGGLRRKGRSEGGMRAVVAAVLPLAVRSSVVASVVPIVAVADVGTAMWDGGTAVVCSGAVLRLVGGG